MTIKDIRYVTLDMMTISLLRRETAHIIIRYLPLEKRKNDS